MTISLRPKFRHLLRIASPSPPNPRWVSSATATEPPPHLRDHVLTFFNARGTHEQGYDRELALVSALKSCASVSAVPQGRQLHSLVVKTGLLANSFVRNSLTNVYAKCGLMDEAGVLFGSCGGSGVVCWNIMIAGYVRSGRLWDAFQVFEKMTTKECVSYTTMIMGFAQNKFWGEAIEVFKDMRVAGVIPNEATLASVIPACSHSGEPWNCRMLHALAIKLLLDSSVIVSTNLLHMYCICSSIEEASRLFEEMPKKNVVSWNVMLNGYSKAGLVDLAGQLFEKIPSRDVVSWGTLIDSYLRVQRLSEALIMCREMLRSGLRPNDVMLVDLVSACARSVLAVEGQQLHNLIVRCGFDCSDFVQATIIHFYAACGRIDLAHLQFETGSKDHLASLNALIAGFVRNGMIDQARQMFNQMSERDVFSWTTMISCYAQQEQPNMALELFHKMVASGLCPNEVTMASVFSAIAALGSLKEGSWAHEYVQKNSIPLNDNLSASIIDMYAKCGSITSALEVFHQVRDNGRDVSPWNAIICGLAMHGHANLSLAIFSNLQKRNIRLNSITFIGALTACCHAGLVEEGKKIFRSMKVLYDVDPDVKHYGCMVDILGRAGRMQEATELIRTMPLEADAAVWGALLSACRTHGNVEIGEWAAQSLENLQPTHGPCRVLLSNIYADVGRWHDAFSARRVIHSQGLKRLPGCSGVG
ncbi:pentatricopeptide repeat-containing protein At5g19020, mitochondrial-like [Syzygium oleosum]|uniref:pentatricopeptide repeat-containing protein At5g19020, mitochondrial-like n=1 Tax=Syzygium oleosum TaxID=219896 RepID=UPI0011D1E8D0|nr:pentatricopeptide repeat-containing protein At5g19020, mitochondrial-like [Syzygium oleosum]